MVINRHLRTITILFSAITILLFPLFHSTVRAECVFLKDGGIVTGRILSESDESVTIRDEKGKIKSIGRGAILRVLYMDLYLGKMIIRLVDGSIIEGYLVDETSDYYTFRKELRRADEFTVPRKKVLFLTRTNPSGLACSSDSGSISCTWYPPYLPPRRYRVYLRKKTEKEFSLATETKWTRATLRGLASRTRYSVRVTAVDGDGTESLPTDEVEVLTNDPPLRPRRLRLKRIVTGASLSARITWDRAHDPDGTVSAYRVYRRDGASFVILAEESDTAYTVTGLEPLKTAVFSVRSVDNDGSESGDSLVSTKIMTLALSAAGSWVMPLRDLARQFYPGYGASISITVENPFIHGLNPGFETGYAALEGKKPALPRMHIVPFLATLQYRFEITDFFSLSPAAAIGASYNRTVGKKYYLGEGVVYGNGPDHFAEPMIRCGIRVTFTIKGLADIGIGADYTAMMERSGVMDFLSLSGSLGFRF